VFVLPDGRPVGRGTTPCGLGESAEGNEFFKSSVDTVALDVTMKETPDLILRQSVAGGLDGFADCLRGLRRTTKMVRDMRGMRGKVLRADGNGA
jgi:hypothetical protein